VQNWNRLNFRPDGSRGTGQSGSATGDHTIWQLHKKTAKFCAAVLTPVLAKTHQWSFFAIKSFSVGEFRKFLYTLNRIKIVAWNTEGFAWSADLKIAPRP
jgi:hypothetical protein